MISFTTLKERVALAVLALKQPDAPVVLRDRQIRRRIDELKGRKAYLVLGDSIAKAADFNTVTGLEPVNASFDGGTASTFLYANRAIGYKALCQTSNVVIALGVNDCRSTIIEKFENNYEQLIVQLGAAQKVLVGISPVEPEKLSNCYKLERIGLFNAVIRGLAEKHSALFVEPLKDVPTADGLHFTNAAYERWLPHMHAFLEKAWCSRN